MKNRTLVKLAFVALLLLPSLASADDNAPKLVLDGHAGVANISFGGDASSASGPGIFADAEAGWRLGPIDLTGFGAYATRHVDGLFDDGSGTNNQSLHYRVHVIDLGARATLRGEHVYGGVGLAFEDEIEHGNNHSPAGNQPIDASDKHVAGELRIGGVFEHLDVSGSVTFASAYEEPLMTARLGIGYRF